MDDEKTLVTKFRDCRKRKADLKAQLESANKELDSLKTQIIESLEARQATKTAHYDEAGHISLTKPQVRPRYLKENEDQVFDYLRGIGRGDLIKETVHPKTLQSFCKEQIEEGRNVGCDYIKVDLIPDVRYYA